MVTGVTRSNCNENKDSVFNENCYFDSKIWESLDTIYNTLTGLATGHTRGCIFIAGRPHERLKF